MIMNTVNFFMKRLDCKPNNIQVFSTFNFIQYFIIINSEFFLFFYVTSTCRLKFDLLSNGCYMIRYDKTNNCFEVFVMEDHRWITLMPTKCIWRHSTAIYR